MSLSNQTTAEDEESKEEGEGPEESIAEAKHDFEVLFAVVWICLNEISRICFLGILFLLIYSCPSLVVSYTEELVSISMAISIGNGLVCCWI